MARNDPLKDPYTAWERGKFRVAFRLFVVQAKAGDSGARLNLGYFYDVGLGTRKNKAQALRWYRRAYQQGSGAAASNIATVYRDEGRPALALAWYKRAVSLKDDDAAVEVAKHYLEGSGVRKHSGLAIAALKRAVTSRNITQAGREEARRLLRRVQRVAT
ncbi:MAG: tetratricopeptide repeat protein [Burkholderiales bacterium]